MNKLILSAYIFLLIMGCKRKNAISFIDFEGGRASFAYSHNTVEDKNELVVRSRFELKPEYISSDWNNYFQYNIEKKIRLVINGDTILPVLSFYVPLIHENIREIDSKFLLNKENTVEKKEIIITDSILGLENIHFKIN